MPPSDRVEALVGELTLEEKVALLGGTDNWHVPAVDRVGIPAFKMTDGPSGTRGAFFTGGPASTNAPCGTALAATFDTGVVRDVAVELGKEARSRGAHLLLAPTVNIHRSPLAGRNFECYSEDPFLAAQMAVAYIDGVQGQGVGATVKHFVANDSEFERFSISSDVGERALREIYLVPFEAAVNQAGTWALMSAYNRLNGTHCSEHEWLLTTLLREEWGWDGLVVSDWFGTHSTAAATNAGLDVEMPGPPAHRGDKLLAAVEEGEVAEETIDTHVRRVLVAAERTGALDGEGLGEERGDDPSERRAVMRAAAAVSTVLLKNDPVAGSPLLPLEPSSLSAVAVIGPNADVAMTQGGGSCHVWPHYTVSPLEGILLQAGEEVDVRFAPGSVVARTSAPRVDLRQLRAADGSPGYTISYFAPGGDEPVLTTSSPRSYFRWVGSFAPEVDPASWWARITTAFTPDDDGPHLLELRGAGRMRLFAAGELVADGWETAGRQRVGANLDLVTGSPIDLVIEYEPSADGAALELRRRSPDRTGLIEEAAAAARAADVAVVVVGTGPDWETEGRDREGMELPGDQGDLVRAVSAANPRTVVVVNSGAPVAMDWEPDVAAIVQCWFAGQELGNGLADVLFGSVNPSGRLPTTIPRRLEDTPAYVNYPGEFGHVAYGEGIFVGYRWYDARDLPVRFPFGHGLSYTTFDYGPLSAVSSGDTVTATLTVANRGPRAGAEVVQLYVSDVEASVARPPKELRAFIRIHLEPGESNDVVFTLDDRAFSFWDPSLSAWRAEPGAFELIAGASSADLRSRATVTRT